MPITSPETTTADTRPKATVTALPRAHQPDLLTAMRRARLEDAERTLVTSDLRAAEIARLEQLRLALAPLFDQAGRELVQFDHGLVASETPRLFIDMIAYVEMGHDRHSYTFIQDTREGPVTLAQSAATDGMVEAVTNYVARRLVERERALASVKSGQSAVRRDAAETALPQNTTATPFGEILAVYCAGAVSGAALIYAATKLGWLG
ncbi:MAG: hypothetical protein ACRCTD_06045 [Beijerinckiaceae bacterium]